MSARMAKANGNATRPAMTYQARLTMTNMLRGRTYSCGCCRSKPGNPGGERARDHRETAADIRDQIAQRDDD